MNLADKIIGEDVQKTYDIDNLIEFLDKYEDELEDWLLDDPETLEQCYQIWYILIWGLRQVLKQP